MRNRYIKLLLIESEMTRKEFAAKLGLSTSSITNILNGSTRVMDKHIKPIADAFGIDEK